MPQRVRGSREALGEGFKAPRAASREAFGVPAGKLLERKDLRNRYGVFADREGAGELLAEFVEREGVALDSILAIPNGGVAVGYRAALRLGVPLAVAVVRKITYPWTTEAGFGAVSWLGDVVVDERVARALGEGEFRRCLERAERSVRERARIFADYLPGDLNGKRVAVVDDGLATGYTMLAAVKAARKLGAREVVAAAPTASLDAVQLLLEHADLLVVLNLREDYPYAVADAYARWWDLTESEALAYLRLLREKETA
jgi:predicted phosphoribosyltransferase